MPNPCPPRFRPEWFTSHFLLRRSVMLRSTQRACFLRSSSCRPCAGGPSKRISASTIRRSCPIRRGASTIAVGRNRRCVEPGETPAQAPADAVVLFDGKDLSQWEDAKGGVPAGVEDGCINILKSRRPLHQAEIRRLPTPYRMGDAHPGRHQAAILVGQQRRLLPRQVRVAGHRIARQPAQGRRTCRRPSTARRRRW